jgi:hypothetical protein
VLRLPTDPEPADVTDVTDVDDVALAESLQDRLRRDEQTARVLREYLVEHPPVG